MLINLSNHPSSKWELKQQKTAMELYSAIMDIDFPIIQPDAELSEVIELANTYTKKIEDILLPLKDQNNAVHLMGEFTFTYNLIEQLRAKNISVIASTTRREVYEDEQANKISKFSFVRFRNYFSN